jgi:hypothetical protein
MTKRWGLTSGLMFLLVGLAGMIAPPPAAAQPWADNNYRYRRPITLQNLSGGAMSSGNVVAYSFIPNFGALDGKTTPTGKDVRVFYYNGTSNVDVPQIFVPMGSCAAKVLFSLQAPIDAGAPSPYSVGTDASSYNQSGTGLGLKADDAVKLVTIPFSFPFAGSTTNQIVVSTNGWLSPNPAVTNTHYGDQAIRTDLMTRKVIMPFASDLDTNVLDGDIYMDTSVPNQVKFTWVADDFRSTGSSTRSATMLFSATLFSSGKIVFNYGDYCIYQDPQNYVPHCVTIGVATGDPNHDLVKQFGAGTDYAYHESIVYNPRTVNVPQATGYWLYYGNPLDSGARTAPPTSAVVSYPFATTVEGWRNNAGNSNTCTLSNVSLGGGRVLRVVPPTATGKLPFVIAGNMADVSDVTAYFRTRGDAVHAMIRANDSNQGYGGFVNDFFNAQTADDHSGILTRNGEGSATDHISIGARVPYSAPTSTWNYTIVRAYGSGANINVAAKMFLENGSDPGRYTYSTTPNNPDQQFNSGKLGLSLGNGADAAVTSYIDWVYAVLNPYAEEVAYVLGTEENLPPPAGQGFLQGSVIDGTTTAPIPSVALVVKQGANTYNINTDANGFYALTVDPGTYEVSASVFGYTPATGSGVVVASGITEVNLVLPTIPNIAVNGSFETGDPGTLGDPDISNVKPLGYYRFAAYAGQTPVVPNPVAETLPWRYFINRADAKDGTRFIGYVGGNSVAGQTYSWESEGSMVGSRNVDNRGAGPMFPGGASGTTYKFSVWYKKSATTNPDIEANPPGTFRTFYFDSDDVGSTNTGATKDTMTNAAVPNWTQFSNKFTVPAGKYLQFRFYEIDLQANEWVYYDDLSVTRVQNPTFKGYVLNSQGAPVGNMMIGVRESTGNGLGDPVASARTDSVGRWSLSFEPEAGKTYVAQAYPAPLPPEIPLHYTASANFPLEPSTERTIIVYDPEPSINIAAGMPVPVASSSGTYSGNVTAPDDVNDDRQTYWYSDTGAYPAPQFIAIDLGQTIDFTKIAQVVIIWTSDYAKHYQLRVGNTAPDPGMTATQAASYGSLLYDSPADADLRTYKESGYIISTDILTKPSLNPVSGRYILLYCDKYTGFQLQFGVWELMVELATGTVNGRVVDQNGVGVADAYVGVHPSGSGFAKTDSGGNYSLTAGVYGDIQLSAHKTDNADSTKVYPVSSPVTVTPVAGTVLEAPTIGLGPAATNLVAAGASASSDRGDLEGGSALPFANLLDRNFLTKWETDIIGEAPPAPIVNADNPYTLTVDLGSTKTINEIVLHWTNKLGANYVVSTSTGGSYTPVYTALGLVSGYGLPNELGGLRYVAAMQFPQRSARYIRVYIPAHNDDTIGAWELQAALSTVIPNPLSAADVTTALRIAAGLTQATSANVSALDQDSDGRITVKDAAAINRKVNGL